MIKKPNELDFSNKKLVVIIGGVAGIGKTTLALSSPKPLLIDLDKGISRVNAKHRTDVDEVGSYEELVNDLGHSDLSAYETLVIDTGGKLLEMLKPVVIKEDAKNGKRDGNLSLQGYGAVKRKFSQFVGWLKTLGKHIVFVFHATEVQLEDDTTGLRIRMEGSSRDEVWDDVDVGGFIEMVGKTRTIGFSNCPRYYAKGTHNIKGLYDIPELEDGTPNDFLTKMFKSIIDDLNTENADTVKYKELMNEFKPQIENAKDEKDLNGLIDKMKKANHILTSKEELWFALTEKAKSLGIEYKADTKKFVKNGQ